MFSCRYAQRDFSCPWSLERDLLCIDIRTMVIGFRNNEGIVSRISPLSIYDIENATVSNVYKHSSREGSLYCCRELGPVNHFLISSISLLISFDKMWLKNIHLNESKSAFVIEDYLKTIVDSFSREVTLFHYIPSSQAITVQKSSDPKYHFLRDSFYKEFHWVESFSLRL